MFYTHISSIQQQNPECFVFGKASSGFTVSRN
jgi:hypothetical protein